MISKIVLIEGDVSLVGLGLSDDDKKLITENVTLVYHAAATIRFDEKIKKAVELNTRGTKEMIKLALECKKLEVISIQLNRLGIFSKQRIVFTSFSRCSATSRRHTLIFMYHFCWRNLTLHQPIPIKL